MLGQSCRIRCLPPVLVFFYGVLTAPAVAASLEVDPELRRHLEQAINSSDSFRDRFEAEVWLMDMSSRLARFVADTEQRLHLLKLVHYEASRVNLPPEMVLAVIQVESRFDRWAISVAGAQGLMQVMPFWLKEIGRPEDSLFDMETNLRLGCRILRYYYDKERGDWVRALARYNGSLGSRRYPDKVLRVLRRNWFRN